MIDWLIDWSLVAAQITSFLAIAAYAKESFSIPWVRYLTLLWMQAPTQATLLSHCFFNEAYCAWRLEIYFWKLFLLLSKGTLHSGVRAHGAGNRALHHPHVDSLLQLQTFGMRVEAFCLTETVLHCHLFSKVLVVAVVMDLLQSLQE